MIYFSEILGKDVLTEDEVKIGILDDFVIDISQTLPKISKIVVKDKAKNKLIIDAKFLIKINHKIYLKKNYLLTNYSPNEIFVLRNILDKQVIDIAGNKLVRVNDVVFSLKGNSYYLSGVDVGIWGFLRRLGIEPIFSWLMFKLKIKITPTFLSWAEIQPLELVFGRVKLRMKENKLKKIFAEDLADYLELTSIENVKKIIGMMDEKKAAEVISDLNINYQAQLFRTMKDDQIAGFLKHIEPDEIVDLLMTFGQKRRDKILSLLPEKKKEKVSFLIKHSKNPIGALMTTEFLTVKPTDTVSETIKFIKEKTADFNYFVNIYVVNQNNQLIGVFNLHEMLLQDYSTPVFKFMHQNLILVHLQTPIEVVLKKMIKYDLQILPVVDKNRRIIGAITIDDFKSLLLEKLKLNT